MTSRAFADDTMATMAAGGLVPVKSTKVAMVREDLSIGVHQIRVSYVFRNDSAQDVTATVAFPLPTLNGPDMFHGPFELPGKSRPNFVDFALTVNGKPITPQIEVRAFVDQKDVTAKLRAAGLSPLAITDYKAFEKMWKSLPKPTLKSLVKSGLIEDEGEKGKPDYYPTWSTKAQFYWTQRFPAHADVRIAHTYKPVVGGGYLYNPNDRPLSAYCNKPGSQLQVAQLFKTSKIAPTRDGSKVIAYLREIGFVLKTANNWNGPIREFHLAVITEHEGDVVSSCAAGLKQVSPTRYESSLKDFSPNDDLKIAIVELAPEARK